MLIIEKVVQQITLQRDGEDTDPAATLLNIDMRSIVADLLNSSGMGPNAREAEERYRKVLEKSRKLERELAEMREQEVRTQTKANDENVKDLKRRLAELENAAMKAAQFIESTFFICLLVLLNMSVTPPVPPPRAFLY